MKKNRHRREVDGGLASPSEALNTPTQHCPAPFLGLTVQPCGEPCGSAAGFDFLTVELIQTENQTGTLVSSFAE
jgi:hypothetical protein